jgi:hypothetical protein
MLGSPIDTIETRRPGSRAYRDEIDTALAGHVVGLVFDPFEFAQVEVLMDLRHEGIPEPLGHTVSAAARADIRLDAGHPAAS